jgi:alpha-galactosidase/6-phospho-beta-glucosidase family protein
MTKEDMKQQLKARESYDLDKAIYDSAVVYVRVLINYEPVLFKVVKSRVKHKLGYYNKPEHTIQYKLKPVGGIFRALRTMWVSKDKISYMYVRKVVI